MPEWIDATSKFGIPVGLLILIGWIFVKFIWPFYTKQVEASNADRRADMEAARADRKEEVSKFVDTIRARDVLLADITERNLKALDGIMIELRGLREEVRNNHK
jgi:hypothetical protein